MHDAIHAYFAGSQCGFTSHNCCLRRYPDYKHIICALCKAINSRWPPPPKDPPKPEKDPNLIYPGDVDPDFKPSRGDILVVNPLHGPSLRKLGFQGSCVASFDGSDNFQFVRGDLLVRLGGYEVKVVEPPPKIKEKKAKDSKPPAKASAADKTTEKNDGKAGIKGAAAKGGKAGAIVDVETTTEPQLPADLVTYKPHEKVEVYYCNGDGQWKFMGTQGNLEMQHKVLLETQCPGLTALYKYFKVGTHVVGNTFVPFLGEVILPEWIWQEDFDHKANKWRAAATWYRPDRPDRAKLRPGMILLRPLVGQMRGEATGLLNVVEMQRAKKLEEAKAKELADQQLLEKFLAMEKANAEAAAAAAAGTKEGDDKKEKKGGKKDKQTKSDKKDEKANDKTKEANKENKENATKEDKKKAAKKGAEVNEKKEETPPVLQPPNNNEILKTPRWGSVEIYRFEGEQEAQGWTYYGRSPRICDTAYPASQPTAKPKFVHEDDGAQIVEPPPQEIPPDTPKSDQKDAKGKKGKNDKKDKDPKKDTDEADKKKNAKGSAKNTEKK